jgi:HD superfamily phosphohydrolase
MPRKPREPERQLTIATELETTHLPVESRPTAEQLPPSLQHRTGTKSTKEQRQEFFLPVSGFVWFYSEEVNVINHPAFQRLGRVYQLGQAYVVYRGATHKRLEHALGTVHIAQRMIEAVNHNGRKPKTGGDTSRRELRESEWRFIRLGALLHDIGHLAAGHTVEDELCLIGKHDADTRLDKIFESRDWLDRAGRTLRELIDSEYEQYLPPSIAGKLSASSLVRLLIRKPPRDAQTDSHSSEQAAALGADDFSVGVCGDIIGNTICADLLDYIHRDWYHVGKPRPFDDRLLQYMEIRVGDGTEDRFVISLGKRPKIRTDAISAILELLEWRYQLAESVLFHRTKASAAAMLDRALFELWGDSKEPLDELLLPLSDEEMLSVGIAHAEKRNDDRGVIAATILKSLQTRELFSHINTRFYDDLPPDVVARIERTYGESSDDPRQSAINRTRALRVLESDFGLKPGSLAMYCPGSMNAKIAKVQIAFGDDIDKFADYERKHNDQLSGGHLDAQLRRFRRLWRVHFFIERSEKNRLGERLYILQQAIDKLALEWLPDDESAAHAVRSLAKTLTQLEGSPWYGQKTKEYSVAGAYQNEASATGNYPMGADSIRSLMQVEE